MLDTSHVGPSLALGTGLPEFVEQQYERYDAEAHDVWRILYERRMATLKDTGSRVFLAGIERIGLAANQVPELAEVNRRLAPRTGWAAIGVRGFIPAAGFFHCLSQRRFPTTLLVRPREQLDYLPEPDIFHDVFGHVPLHSHPVFANFLQQFGAVAADARSEQDITAMARLFWFTVEFGLIREDGAMKIYGSGLISSHADAANALGPKCDRRRFDLDSVLAQPFEIDHFQNVLFVIESFEELFEAVNVVRDRLARGRPARSESA
jgi:phenylalanine-4-hydroxylase